MKHVLYKIKAGKENRWREWCGYLWLHESESKATMREENCVYERSGIFLRDGEYYAVGTCLFEGEPKKADLSIEINALHHEAKNECLGSALGVFSGEFLMPPKYEILYEFDLRKS